MDILTIRKPFDAHQHLRDGELLRLVAPMVAKRFCGAVVMPNLKPPVVPGERIEAYRKEIRAALPPATEFEPYMTVYLTDTIDLTELEIQLHLEDVCGAKYYPRGLTTNSNSGIANPAALWTKNTVAYEALEILAKRDGILFVHAADGFDEDGAELDPFDQEPHFITETLPRIIDAHPNLKISVEHLSSAAGAAFMLKNGGERLGCSLTAHHLLLDRRDMFRGGFRPHRFWWPIIQRAEHKEALRELVQERLPFVWLGSDSAPHPVGSKENDCCSGGVLLAHAGIELYVEAFDEMGCLDALEDFASINFLHFLGKDGGPCEEIITLVRESWKPRELFFCDEEVRNVQVIPFRLGEEIKWKLLD